jgi:uncharacterized membrane protein HdeD (DUF308 family)
LFADVFETLGIVLVIAALSAGAVVIVSPIVATSPSWILLGTWLFLRGIEGLSLRTICRRRNDRDIAGAVTGASFPHLFPPPRPRGGG